MTTHYEKFGGSAFFTSLTAAFYQRVAADDVLRPMYPDADLAEAERRLRMFLEQYWGGPTTYGEERGHPRLRMRHMPFAIGIKERDQWLACMGQAMGETEVPEGLRERLKNSFFQTADWMRNKGV